MTEDTIQIEIPGAGSISAIRTTPVMPASGWLFAYAPGAGSNVHDPFGAHACSRLSEKGIAGLRFQFPYAEAGRRRPDRPPVLEATWRSVIDTLPANDTRLVVGGRSMGGRIASQVVARGAKADALALFAYPLRPPYNRSLMRDEHMPSINVPTLFVSGTRDGFARPEDLEAAASKVPHASVHLLEGADHGFSVLKASERTRQQVWDEAIDATLDWLDTLD